MRLDPAVAACRLAVRRALPLLSDGRGGLRAPQVRKGGSVTVACSGGADSLALLAATIFSARTAPFEVIGVVVDHGLQEGSADHTARVVKQMDALGADQTASVRVDVDPRGQGVEGGARAARYAALAEVAKGFGSDRVLVGHTRDDQAETVLLGLTHGSGPRSLQGMRRLFHPGPRSDGEDQPAFLRPFLELSRAQTEAACRAERIEWWTDPHNADPRFTRSRIRHTVMPMLERELGPGIADALARTADLACHDVEALDKLAEHALQGLDRGEDIDTDLLQTYDEAVKTRVIRLAALNAGVIASDLTRDHIQAVSSIVCGGGDGRQVQLPGHVTAYRDGNHLRFRRTSVES